MAFGAGWTKTVLPKGEDSEENDYSIKDLNKAVSNIVKLWDITKAEEWTSECKFISSVLNANISDFKFNPNGVIIGPVIRVSRPLPETPPPPWVQFHLLETGIAKFFEALKLPILYSRRGCLACPVGQMEIVFSWPPSPGFLTWLQTIASIPYGCSPAHIYIKRYEFAKYAVIGLLINMPIPIDLISAIATQSARSIIMTISKFYELLPLFNKRVVLDVYLKPTINCMAADIISLTYHITVMRACLEKAADELKEGLKLAEQIERAARRGPFK